VARSDYFVGLGTESNCKELDGAPRSLSYLYYNFQGGLPNYHGQ
jgi:hypothetical protein